MRRTVPEPLMVLQVIANYGEIKGRITLHKLIHHMQTKKGLDLGYKFLNYSFGPYSKELEEDLKLLKSLGLIVEERSSNDLVIKITKKGIEAIKNLEKMPLGMKRTAF